MLLRGKPLESVDETDLQALVDNEVAEGKSIEYKLELPKNSDGDKKEFLADLSSLANATGGHLIYGIKEKGGVAKEVTGLEISKSIDEEKLRLEDIIRNGIAPRISGIKICPIKLHDSKFVIIIEVPKSWAMPHMVIFKGHSRFYSRTSAGKYPLDVSELRAAFVLSESIAEKMRNFRIERLSKVVSGETPVRLKEEIPKTILHIVPFTAFDSSKSIDISSFENKKDVVERLRPLDANSWDNRYNIDGFLTFNLNYTDNISTAYVQFFRNGSLEAVEASMLEPFEGRKIIPHAIFEYTLVRYLTDYLQVLQIVGIEPPFIIMLSLFGVEGYRIPYPAELRIARTIDRDTLVLPEVILQDYKFDASEIMRPIFNALWNSAGLPRSMNYDAEGKWNPRR